MPSMDAEKSCTKCGQVKPLADFWLSATGKGGRRADCKICRGYSQHRWRLAHLARQQAKDRAYYHRHKQPGARKEYQAQWYQHNKQRTRLLNRAYAVSHRAQGALRTARYKAKKSGLEATLTEEQWKAIKALFQQKCIYCGKRTRRLEKEHVVPVSKGGNLTLHNIVPACRPCNAKKATKPPMKPIRLALL